LRVTQNTTFNTRFSHFRHQASALALGLVLATAFAGSIALPQQVQAQQQQQQSQDGVKVGRKSRALAFASAEQVEAEAAQQYAQLKQQASQQGALAPPDYPTVVRLRKIAERIIQHAPRFNERAANWKWEVNLIGSKQINAFCMPGGKIAFYTGIIDTLRLTDDEIATVMGHEVAHALREHGRERAGKAKAAQVATVGMSIISQLFGFGDLGGMATQGVAKLTLLKYGRDDESESDLVGMDLAARAGYDPRAGIVLWQKMSAISKGAPPQWLSTHPSHTSRIAEIEKHLPEVLPLYAKATNRDVYSLPPYQRNWSGS
jgi:predicted Zn-dependent protease